MHAYYELQWLGKEVYYSQLKAKFNACVYVCIYMYITLSIRHSESHSRLSGHIWGLFISHSLFDSLQVRVVVPADDDVVVEVCIVVFGCGAGCADRGRVPDVWDRVADVGQIEPVFFAGPAFLG
jgi:hypothetical protein